MKKINLELTMLSFDIELKKIRRGPKPRLDLLESSMNLLALTYALQGKN